MRIVFGLIGVILSILLLVYRVPIKHFIGQFNWAEQKLGPGGTYTVLVLIAILGFFLSLMYMTDSFDVLYGGIGVDFFGSVK